jgi:hypothetical protein
MSRRPQFVGIFVVSHLEDLKEVIEAALEAVSEPPPPDSAAREDILRVVPRERVA